MIIRIDCELVESLNLKKKPEQKTAKAVIFTENGVQKIPFQKISREQDFSHVDIPSWFKEAMTQSQIITITQSDYNSLPTEILPCIEVLKP